MYPILLAHEDSALRALIADKLQFMFDLDVVSSGQALMERLQSRLYMAAIVGMEFRDVSTRVISTWMRTAECRQPLQMFLIRTDLYFGSAKEILIFDQAVIVSIPSQIQMLIDGLVRVSTRVQRQKWLRLSPVQKDLIDTHLSIYHDLNKKNIEETINSRSFDKGIDLLVETSDSQTIETILEAMRDYDDYTFAHQMSVASLLVMFGVDVGIPKKDLRILAQAGILHDVGKREVPIEVLHKPGKLNEAEWVLMRSHVQHSIAILGRIDGLSKHVIRVAAQHHECLDGSGYPYGLKGGEIDDLSLVCSVADVFSALTDKRPYKPAISQRRALQIMAGLCGTQIDGAVFRHFKEMIERSGRYRAEAEALTGASSPLAAE